MNTFRFVKISKFPDLIINQEISNQYQSTLPGFTEAKQTSIKCVNKNYHGFELYEVSHELIIKEIGLAFGYVDNNPVTMELSGYKKKYTVKLYYKKDKKYAFISESSAVVKDLIKTFKRDISLQVELEEIDLDFTELSKHVDDYTGAWFKGVSSRVTSTALFGANLSDDPLFSQLKKEGANLSSIVIPFGGIQIQISKSGGISSQQTIRSIRDQLSLVTKIKDNLFDKIMV
ncbi:hypothetical protein [Chryseobacterium echinoideorum]|uniref:hypothetical protein n=1 Tax=Chryseobacterium echinoideorum TaxID=1549648 RepID=UPI0011849764|nr:hypothetical protein [Chryseobacterium echinoideorum]